MDKFIALLHKEILAESLTTRKMLSRFPEDNPSFRPHPKSTDMRALAIHIADLPAWIDLDINTDELDFESSPYRPTECNNAEELVAFFDASLAKGLKALEKADVTRLDEIWTLRSGATILSQTTRYEMMRMSMSQIVHHRAQLGVYLRLQHIPIPGSYGPSADEMTFS